MPQPANKSVWNIAMKEFLHIITETSPYKNTPDLHLKASKNVEIWGCY